MRFVSNIKTLKMRKTDLRPAVSEKGKNPILVSFPREKQGGGKDVTKKSNYSLAAADRRLLESFWTRKNVEREENCRKSEISNVPAGDEEGLREVFSLTRRLLVDSAGPLNDRFIQNDTLLEKALGTVHKHLPLPVRLGLWKKKYIQFILTNRERLIP